MVGIVPPPVTKAAVPVNVKVMVAVAVSHVADAREPPNVGPPTYVQSLASSVASTVHCVSASPPLITTITRSIDPSPFAS